jgi:hypothetical protein
MRTHEPPVRNETVWAEYGRSAQILFIDGLLFLSVIAILFVSFWALRLLELSGYSKERIEVLEEIHFWAMAGVTVVFCFDMFMKALAALGRETK